MNTEFNTMVKKQEEIENLKSCIRGLKIFFDYASIDMLKFHRQHGKKSYKKFDEALKFMYDNFENE